MKINSIGVLQRMKAGPGKTSGASTASSKSVAEPSESVSLSGSSSSAPKKNALNLPVIMGTGLGLAGGAVSSLFPSVLGSIMPHIAVSATAGGALGLTTDPKLMTGMTLGETSRFEQATAGAVLGGIYGTALGVLSTIGGDVMTACGVPSGIARVTSGGIAGALVPLIARSMSDKA